MNTKMLAIAAILMVVTATIGTAFAAQDQSLREELRGKRLLHHYNVVYLHTEQVRIGMEAVIDYAKEVKADHSELEVLKNNFNSDVNTLERAANDGDFDEFQTTMEGIRDIIQDFRSEAHSVLGENVPEARERVKEALEDNEDYLNSLWDDVNSARIELELEAFDETLDAIEERVDEAEDRGVDVSEVRAKIDEINDKRDDISVKGEAAVTSCTGIRLGLCETTEAQEYRDLREEIKEDFVELREIARDTIRKHAITTGIDASQTILERAREGVTKAEERGIDVTTVTAQLDEVEDLIDSAQAKLDEKDYEGALDELRAARTAFVDAMQEFRDTVRSDLESRRQARSTEGRPNGTIDGGGLI